MKYPKAKMVVNSKVILLENMITKLFTLREERILIGFTQSIINIFGIWDPKKSMKSWKNGKSYNQKMIKYEMIIL